MLGDGINDSPALSAASVGIAVSDGAAIAREIADVTIAAEDLYELVKLRELAMALMRRIDADYRFVIGFNGTLIALGAAGALAPAASAMLHNLSTLCQPAEHDQFAERVKQPSAQKTRRPAPCGAGRLCGLKTAYRSCFHRPWRLQ